MPCEQSCSHGGLLLVSVITCLGSSLAFCFFGFLFKPIAEERERRKKKERRERER